MSARDELPLTCMARGGVIDMFVGINTLCFAAENYGKFWYGVSDVSVPNIKITSLPLFAKAVVEAINKEAEDGSNMLSRMLDKAIDQAVENGCEGVELPE